MIKEIAMMHNLSPRLCLCGGTRPGRADRADEGRIEGEAFPLTWVSQLQE